MNIEATAGLSSRQLIPVSSAATVGGALGSLLAGYVFDLTGSYRVVLWCLPLISSAGLGATLMLRPPERR